MGNEELHSFLRTVSFTRDNDGFYVGQGQNNRNGQPFKLAILEDKIACFVNDLILFQVPKTINLGTFLVLAQEFGIIHERFIYERVEVIEDEFLEAEEWNEDDDEKDLEDARQKQIIQMKNSKFMQLLNKGKKKQS